MKPAKIVKVTALPLLLVSSATGAVGASGTNGAGHGVAQGAARPNVLYIMTDQQSFYMISAITKSLGPNHPYGNNEYFHTPNLDRLVAGGYTFSNCYASHPVSGPSRYSLLTGESPNSVGMYGNFSPGGANGEKVLQIATTRAMGTLFKKAGYQTYYGGKVHLPWAAGRSGKNSINDAPVKYGFDQYLTEDDRAELAQKGVEFLSGGYKGKEPFLLFLSFMNPHDICMVQMLFNDKTLEDFPPDVWRERRNQILYRGIYRSLDSTLFDGDQLARLPFNQAKPDRFPVKKFGQVFKLDDYRTRVQRWFYYRLTEEVDGHIGQVLDALERSPYKNNTIIVFTSDHGEMAGSHGLTGKNVPFEECQKIPLIFVGKGVQKGVIDNTTPVCNGWDMLPTLLDLAGIKIPAELNGLSLLGTITAGKPVDRKYLYQETVRSYGVLESGRFKYTRFLPDKSCGIVETDNEALFDLQKDPGELHNLVYDKSQAAKLNELRAALAVEMQRYGTTFKPFESAGLFDSEQ